MAQLVDDIPIVQRERGLLNRMITAVLQGLFHQLAHRAQFAGDSAEMRMKPRVSRRKGARGECIVSALR